MPPVTGREEFLIGRTTGAILQSYADAIEEMRASIAAIVIDPTDIASALMESS
jgi:hypothetical protein